MRGIARRGAVEVPFVEVKVLLSADSAELRILFIEILKASSEAFQMPAADNKHTLRAHTFEHLSEALFSNALRQDSEGVHAHAAESECAVLPELMVGLESFLFDDVI